MRNRTRPARILRVLLATAAVVLVSGVTACAAEPATPPAAPSADRLPEAGGCAAVAVGIPVFAVDCTDRLATAKVLAVADDCFAVDGVDSEKLDRGRRLCLSHDRGAPVATANLAKPGDCVTAIESQPMRRVACTDPAAAERVLATIDSASTTPSTECSATPGTRTIYPWTLLPAPDGSTSTPARARVLCLGPKDQAAGTSVDSAKTGDCLNEKADYAVVPCAAKEATAKVLRRLEKPADAAQACAALPITSVFDATAAGGFALCLGRVR